MNYWNFLIKYGNGGWKLVSAAVETPFNVPDTKRNKWRLHLSIRLATTKNSKGCPAQGQLIYKLENRDGLHVTITVSVKES
ncbi:MAG: hypothetical protein ACLTGI_07655 [Hoylesella buccalis]